MKKFECPQCKSESIVPVPIGLVLIATAGCFIWIPIVGWILAPIILIGAILIMIAPNAQKWMRCLSCKHQFNMDKNEYRAIFKEMRANKRKK